MTVRPSYSLPSNLCLLQPAESFRENFADGATFFPVVAFGGDDTRGCSLTLLNAALPAGLVDVGDET